MQNGFLLKTINHHFTKLTRMFTRYDPLVSLMILFLKNHRVVITHAKVQEDLESHPDWPSLLSLSDTLQKWKIPNNAGQISQDKVEDIPLPFLATIPTENHDIVLVTAVTAEKVTYESYLHKYHKVEESIQNFKEKWDGIFLIAEPNQNTIQSGIKRNRIKNVLPGLSIIISILLLYSLFGFSFFLNLETSDHVLKVSTLHSFILFQIQLTGVIITSILLWFEIDKFNPSLNKFCSGALRNANCNAILNSKGSKVFNWLSWSEIGFYYFSGSFLNLIFYAGSIYPFLVMSSWLNLLVLPYIIFSIYYQWRIIKQWCILCLSIQFLLLIGFLNSYFSNLLTGISISTFDILKILSLFLLPVVTWNLLKPKLLKVIRLRKKIKEFTRLKYNQIVFTSLLEAEAHYTALDAEIGLVIGNPNAKNQIVKVCSPYCSPCSYAHKILHDLVESSEDISVRIIFKATNRKEDIAGLVTKHILSIASGNNHSLTKQALNDWYSNNKKDFAEFKDRYPLLQIEDHVSEHIEKMDDWCKQNKIYYTPTLFINGRKLPQTYNAEDIRYFLSE